MSTTRKVFADLKKGDKVEVSKDPRQEGKLDEVTELKSNKYGLKFRTKGGFICSMSRENADNLGEYFDRRSRLVFRMVQDKKASSADK
jgi:hypothetical protein